MKVREVREVLEKLARIHDHLGSRECAAALGDLGKIMQPFDTQTVAAFVNQAAPKEREND